MTNYFSKSLSIILVIAMLGLYLPANASEKRDNQPIPIEFNSVYKPGEVLVKFKGDASSSSKLSAKRSSGIAKTLKRMEISGKKRLELLQIKEGETVESSLKKLRKQKDVEVAEPNYLHKPSFTPNDTNFSNQWGLHNTGQTIQGSPGTADADIDAVEAWDLEQGASNPVTVAVIDSGIDTTHPDLSAKLWQNTGEIAGNDIDDDANGYVDDVNGYNWAGISQYYYNAVFNLGRTDADPFAQSFKGTGQRLTSITLGLSKVGSPASSITGSIRSDINGVDLATFSISAASTPTYPTIYSMTTNLSSTLTLTNGQTYYIIFQTATANADNYYYFIANTELVPGYLTNPFTEGQMYEWGGESWDSVSFQNDDIYFATNADPFPRDNNGHGTHVSGIIAADSNNSQGIAGVSDGAKIMALKAGDSSGSLYTSDIIDAINYAKNNGADIINMSFGSTSLSASEQDALTDAYNAGVTLFAASGNSSDTTMQYPAGMTNVIGVGATTNTDTKASFSTYNSSVDISAPGQNIYSTMPTFAAGMNSRGYSQTYSYMSGTSMASPMAAGVGALIKSKFPAYTPAQVQSLLENYADDLGTPGRDDSFGYGRVNAYNSLNIDATPPTDPSGLLVTTTSTTQIDLSWTISTDSGGSGLTGYKIERAPDNAGAPGAFSQVGTSGSNSYSDSTLSVNTKYWYKVRAYDGAGNNSGYSSNSTTTTLSDPPTSPAATDGDFSNKINVSWSASATADHYHVFRDGESGSGTQIHNASAINFDDTIAGNHSYYIYAVNSADAESVTYITDSGYTAAATPADPTIATTQVLSTTSIRWNFSDNANDETGFKIHDMSHSTVASTAAINLSYVDETGLSPNIQYTRHVHAYNGQGDSGASADASVYTLAEPASLPVASDGSYDSKIAVTWSASSAADHYHTYRDGQSGSGTLIHNSSALSFEDSVTGNHSYFIYAVNGDDIENSSYISNSGFTNTAPSMSAITSASHPNSSVFYSNPNPTFNFGATDDQGIAGYSYILDKSSGTTPDQVSEGLSTSVGFYNLSGGTWYFHVRAVDGNGVWTATSHYKIIIDSYKPRTFAPYKYYARRNSRGIARPKLYWKVYDPYTANKAYVKLKIKKRTYSRTRAAKKAYYYKRYRSYKSRYLYYRTRNRTIAGRYYRGAKIYFKRYRSVKVYYWRHVRTVDYRWTTINRTRYYRWRLTTPGTYKFYVLSKDQAGNSQRNVARNYIIVR